MSTETATGFHIDATIGAYVDAADIPDADRWAAATALGDRSGMRSADVGRTTRYREWTEHESRHHTGQIALRDQLLTDYDAFAPVVGDIRQATGQTELERLGVSRLGFGHQMQGYRFEHQGEALAAKLPHDRALWTTAYELNSYVTALVIGGGHPSFERPVAASYRDRAIISSFVPGSALSAATPDVLDAVTDEHVDTLIDAARYASDRLITLDFRTSDNTRLDPEAGFGFIDYGATARRGTPYTRTAGDHIGLVVKELAGHSPEATQHYDGKEAAARWRVIDRVLTAADAADVPVVHHADSLALAGLASRALA